jgi:hypothetical protein
MGFNPTHKLNRHGCKLEIDKSSRKMMIKPSGKAGRIFDFDDILEWKRGMKVGGTGMWQGADAASKFLVFTVNDLDDPLWEINIKDNKDREIWYARVIVAMEGR